MNEIFLDINMMYHTLLQKIYAA